MTDRSVKRTVMDDATLQGSDACRDLSAKFDTWVTSLFERTVGTNDDVALVALGGYGRRELAPHSDLDLLLVYRGKSEPETANGLWYPIWDEGIKLGHAVRTVADTIALATTDIATASALLSTRVLAGNQDLADELITHTEALWTNKSRQLLGLLGEANHERHRVCGDVAYDLEPDLKDGRGGLRDIHALNWAYQALERPSDELRAQLRVHNEALLRARVALHRTTATPSNRLTLQDQDEVAAQLGEQDADMLMAIIAASARAVAWMSDEFWFDYESTPPPSKFRRPQRAHWLDGDFELDHGRVCAVAGARPDELSILKAARLAASPNRRLSPSTLEWLQPAPPLPEPWPQSARELFVELLATGRDAIPVIESLDQRGLWLRLIPEWAPNSSKPQRNAYHHFTVDRHLLEAVAVAQGLAEQVTRPDLLLMGALLHDIGKGYPGDHAIVGIDLARSVAHRMGFSEDDISVLAFLVEHHLLLADTATRRDLEDPTTIRTVAAHAGDPARLQLLAALTEADSIATGTAAWSTWKSGLVYSLADRVQHVLTGGDIEDVTIGETIRPASLDLLEMARSQGLAMEAHEDSFTIVSSDEVGLFHRVAGVLALNGLDIVDATVHTIEHLAIEEFRVSSAFSGDIAWSKVERDMHRALTGRFALEPRLAERARTYRRRVTSARTIEPRVKILADESEDATVIEVYGPDSVGLLFRITRALADLDCNILKAKISTMGNDVIDAFYVRGRAGAKITEAADHNEIRSALTHAMLAAL